MTAENLVTAEHLMIVEAATGTVGGGDMLPGLAGVPRWATRAGKVPAQAGRYRGLRVGAAPPPPKGGAHECEKVL